MINKLFLAFTLIGSEWVLWFLLIISIVSIALMLERWLYFKKATPNLEAQVEGVLKPVANQKEKAMFLIDAFVAQLRLDAEKRLSWLATIGSNAPFVGLFGTVLGIIKAFHDLAQLGTEAAGSSLVSGGISEALVATAVGLFVAIPAVIAYNHFQRKVKDMLLRVEKAKNQTLAKAA